MKLAPDTNDLNRYNQIAERHQKAAFEIMQNNMRQMDAAIHEDITRRTSGSL